MLVIVEDTDGRTQRSIRQLDSKLGISQIEKASSHQHSKFNADLI